MRLSLLGHSGFLLETPDAPMIFDYYTDEAHGLARLDPKWPALVFVSHRHPDHWNPDILRLAPEGSLFLIEQDCPLPDALPAGFRHLKLQVGESYASEALAKMGLRKLDVFGSTDEGASVLLTLNTGLRLFFAGDLNDWDWADEDSPAMEAAFEAIVQEIAQALGPDPRIDLVFFPVDARLDAQAFKGALAMARHIQIGHLIPMHLAGGTTLPARLKQQLPQTETALIYPGDIIEV